MAITRVRLPTLHEDQVNIFRLKRDARGGEWEANAGGRFKAVRCGRRYGKSTYGETWVADGSIKTWPCGWFAPDYKRLSEVYQDLSTMLRPITESSSKTEGVIRLRGGGRIDFWTLLDDSAGRSRMYKRVVIDEGAFTRPNMIDIWEKSIKPTLLDLNGEALVASNTNGIATDNFLHAICTDPKHGFIEYHAPSWANPTIPRRLRNEVTGEWAETLEEQAERRKAIYDDLRARTHPLVFAQEYAAEFVDWSGVAFFDPEKWMVGGKPIQYPAHCDYVFCIVDSATKTGAANDSTAVTWYARSRFGIHPLVILDWDIVQVEGAMLEEWLPGVIATGEALALQCKARSGFLGAFIEDKDSGQILLQQAAKRGMKAHPIASDLTAKGKDGRAISVSGYHYRGECKISAHAFEKTKDHKGTNRNHFWAQVTGFRVGAKEEARRADDLLDTYCYGLAVGLGDSDGH